MEGGAEISWEQQLGSAVTERGAVIMEKKQLRRVAMKGGAAISYAEKGNMYFPSLIYICFSSKL